MSISELTPSAQKYLKVVWSLSEWTSSPVTPSLIADRVGLRLSSVSEGIRKLSTQGFLEHAPYGSVELTESGRRYAVQMVRRHRLLETFLVEVLGYSWDQVHDEAENLEHAVSDFMVERIDELLEFPSRDPHGDPIPSASGAVDSPAAVPLSDVGAGQDVSIERISDEDPQMLKFFEDHGFCIGKKLSISQGAPFSGVLEARISGAKESVLLGAAAVKALYVSIDSQDAIGS
ncbi:metal-dependent transcriptional regulator [Glutamicibacter sp. BW77]|uniref:metal-dependent transcriptional regulator n=1 Tax=Glutamicibacter TaxID=1742989 RepID=UPI000BB6F6F9|nr:metal-dependent transcriptional regulator [Glutamicibacter sp. BW77]PCC36209.1 transcriptional regulator [Glutamicibacter sp. BW77]